MEVDAIPTQLLLDTPAFPSALHVFAGVGGLALLAEHLPLLYPEVTRQVTPLDSSKDGGSGGGNPDWVAVESAEDIYEVSVRGRFGMFVLLQDSYTLMKKTRRD